MMFPNTIVLILTSFIHLQPSTLQPKNQHTVSDTCCV